MTFSQCASVKYGSGRALISAQIRRNPGGGCEIHVLSARARFSDESKSDAIKFKANNVFMG